MTKFFSYNVPYIGRYTDPFITLVPNICTPHSNMCHISFDKRTLKLLQIASNPQLHINYTFAKCQKFSVTHVPYFIRYRKP